LRTGRRGRGLFVGPPTEKVRQLEQIRPARCQVQGFCSRSVRAPVMTQTSCVDRGKPSGACRSGSVSDGVGRVWAGRRSIVRAADRETPG